MTRTAPPILLWLRRDLRLADNPMLDAAVATGRPLVPVFIHDASVEGLGAAARWRLGQGLATFAERLEAAGSRLILRRGPALEVLAALARETGAQDVWWARLYDAPARARDGALKPALKAAGLGARSFPGHLLHEPWEVQTGQGGAYRVYSPFWRAMRGRDVATPAPAPRALRPPAAWPVSDRLQDWEMGRGVNRGAAVLAKHARTGEAEAAARLAEFIESRIVGYRARRDYPAAAATSGLSENLTWGEIGARQVWHAALAAMQEGAAGAEHFLKELAWREFAWHLMYHYPEMDRQNWRSRWDAFPWSRIEDAAVLRWKQGRSGVPLVDAAMREMYVTGTMHNRARMIVASYLTKHMLVDWRVGLAWFADCLTDWDLAANAMGWQWVAGSGPDAAPYFRIFNPATQAAKFDPDGTYVKAHVAELSDRPGGRALDFFAAAPRAWGLAPDSPYPAPVVGLAEGRARALAAFAALPAADG